MILLIDQPFFDSRKAWESYFESLGSIFRNGQDILVPVSICSDAHLTSKLLRDINCVPVSDPGSVDKDESLFLAIFISILNLLPETTNRTANTAMALPPRVFLCHTKTDGAEKARKMRRYLYEHTQMSCFFDTHDIPHGRGVKEFIEASIAECCMMVVWTDHLLDSRWCQYEILEAWRQQRPLIVVDALNRKAPRIFPFLGNMPVVRWKTNQAEILNALLLELIRTRHTQALFEALCDDVIKPNFLFYPPDLFHRIKNPESPRGQHGSEELEGLVIYPDPPLAPEEVEALRVSVPHLRLRSLSEWWALRSAGALAWAKNSGSLECKTPLAKLTIGLSVSEADDWRNLGLIEEHHEDFILDLARELILLGARLLWGGDLRPKDIGKRLEGVVGTYHQADHAPQDHLACYLAWPIHHNKLLAKDLRERRAFADVRCFPAPSEDLENPALAALCYSLLRQQLARDCDARVVLGGRLVGYSGRYPGIIEEVFEAIRLRRPVYMVGGFGGAAQAAFDVIVKNGGRMRMEKAWQERCADPVFQKMNAAYDLLARGENLPLCVDHEEVLRVFEELRLQGLSKINRLTEQENQRLAVSQDIPEIISLLVKGLAACAKGRLSASS